MEVALCLGLLGLTVWGLPGVTGQPPGFDYSDYIRRPPTGVLKFAVFIQTKHPPGSCSGTLVRMRWVVTAAQCVQHEGSVVDAGDVKVIAGISDYTNLKFEEYAQTRTGSKVIVHPEFRSGQLSKFDIALIQVHKEFNVTRAVGKIKMGSAPWPTEGNRSKNCVSWGFGNVGPRVLDNNMLKIWNTTATYGPQSSHCFNKFQKKRLLVSKEAVGVNLCRGDLGSSLVCYDGPSPFEYLWGPLGDAYKGLYFKVQGSMIHSYKKLKDPQASAIRLNALANKTILLRVADMKQVKMYGVAHMTVDKYRCDIDRTLKTECVGIPTIATYMYLCPFNAWLRLYMPDEPETVSCGASALPSNTGVGLLVMAAVSASWTLVHY